MAVTQSERAEVPSSHRSIVPTVPGVPAGAAVLIAVTCTFIGFFIDSGGSELTGTFATLYVLGCLLAVAAVRYRGLFTTMVLPPLLLFLSVPLAYQLMIGNSGGGSGSSRSKLGEMLLNLAIPLVNRFPTMALATVLVLIVGAIRVALHRRELDGTALSALRRPQPRTPRPTTAGPRTPRTPRSRPAADAKDPKDATTRRRGRAADKAESTETPAAGTARRRPAGRVAER
ncbi:DUF6542 domain-containing protein, partial [Nocardia sp. NPDC005978]|uniref:DUF6542 domain-containing protein n=1 Tax=Nocardia sp. NPDC005978 TaxID=3156725 RepID=UPI0033BA453D